MSILKYISSNDCPCENKKSYDHPCEDDKNKMYKIYKYIEDNNLQNSKIYESSNLPKSNDKDSMAIKKVAAKINCKSELCVWKKILSEKEYIQTLNMFKLIGPRDNTQWLSNRDIDITLSQWAKKFDNLYNYTYNMLNFKEYNGPLDRYKIHKLIDGKLPQLIIEKDKYNDVEIYLDKYKIMRHNKYAAGVINTATTHDAHGKHWVSFFIDISKKTIEYFNSSGNPPPKEIINWFKENEKYGFVPIIVTNLRHQKYNTECGMYSLCFIRSRLDGVDHTYFRKNYIDDKYMEEYRKHIFALDT